MFAVRLANGLAAHCEVHFFEFNSFVSINKAQKKLLLHSIPIFAPDANLLLKAFVYLRYKITKKENLKIDLFIDKLRAILLYFYLVRNKIEVINSHAILQNDTLVLLKKLNQNLKIVLTLHGHYEFHELNHPATFKHYISNHANHFDKVVYTTLEQKQNFMNHGLNEEKASLIFYGFEQINKPKSAIDKTSSFNIILHSRAVIEKGWLQAIDAVIHLKNKGYNISLTLIGDGHLVLDLWEKYQLDYLEILGFKSDIFPYIERAQLGLLPTYFSGESLPNSIIECLHYGKPVISTTIGAIPQMLQTEIGVAGELIETKKGTPVDVTLLSDLIERYLVDENYLEQKRKVALFAFEKFKMSNCIKAYENVFFE